MPDWFVKGGVVMWPLLVCSVAAVAIVIERIWALQRRRVVAPALAAEIQRQPRTPDLTERTRLLAANDESVLGELTRTALGHAWLSKSENTEAVQAMARQMMARMERGFTTLALVVELGPLLGLLGAVAGMVHVFGDVAQHGLSDPALISRGISEALIATFTGLAISIPALVAYMYLRRRVDILALELERHLDELLKHLYH
jgi:biopolymer transport protein ExbB